MEYIYHIEQQVWKKWPLVEGVKYFDSDDNGYMTYDKSLIRSDLAEELRRLNLEIAEFHVFYTCPDIFAPIHIDGFLDYGEIDENTNRVRRRENCAINWSFTLPGVEWAMAWYKPHGDHAKFEKKSEKFMQHGDLGLEHQTYTYERYHREHCDKIFECTWIENPVLLKTDTPHNILMRNRGKRWCASMRFDNYAGLEEFGFNYLRNLFESDLNQKSSIK
jgi:hypothetical protein